MSKISYRTDLTIAQNIAKVREHTGLTNESLGRQIGISGSVFGMYASCGFKTNAGNESSITKKVKAHVETFFIDGIPDLVFTSKKENLFELFGCAACEFRSKSQKGCMKFSLTKNEINGGYFINTIDHGSFALSRSKPCPYATK